jgi:EspA/EspE family/Excreted virulence factor EspC, type VII ESX diderm
MGFWDGVEDTFKSVAEANVLPIGVIANLAKIGDDPAGALTGIGGLLSPSLGFVSTLPLPWKDNTEPNISGAGGLPVFAATLATLKQMRDQCGTGEPDQGANFDTGKYEFQLIADMVGSADAPDTWQGVASEAYGAANHHQKRRADNMADADAKVQQALSTEAGQVTETRQTLDGCIEVINQCIPIATMMAALPVGGNAASYGFQVQTSEPVLLLAYTSLQDLTDAVLTNTAEVRLAAGLYNAIGADNGALRASTGDQLKVVTADLRRVSGDQDLIAAKIGLTSQTTAGTAANVAKTHGTACGSTSDALCDAVTARAATVTIMKNRSERLSDGLQTAANRYDTTDREGGGKIERSMHPR